MCQEVVTVKTVRNNGCGQKAHPEGEVLEGRAGWGARPLQLDIPNSAPSSPDISTSCTPPRCHRDGFSATAPFCSPVR